MGSLAVIALVGRMVVLFALLMLVPLAFAVLAHDAAEGEFMLSISITLVAGLLLSALHAAGLATLTHTPNPMRFLNQICGRPKSEKPVMIIVAGHATADATIPVHATIKKPLDQIMNWL